MKSHLATLHVPPSHVQSTALHRRGRMRRDRRFSLLLIGIGMAVSLLNLWVTYLHSPRL
jgi:hypothetical protein